MDKLLAIHKLTLKEAIKELNEMKKRNIRAVITTYALKEFLDKLSFAEKVEWDLFNNQPDPPLINKLIK